MLETARLILTPMALEDAPFVYELLNTKEWIENIGDRNVRSIEDAKKYIKDKMIDHFTVNGYGNYRMIRKSDNAKIGCISLYNREDVEGVDIGFAMLPAFMKKGYAFEGARFIRDYAKNVLGLSGITAFTSKENIGSQRLIEKLGLTFKKTILFGDEQDELLFYELKF